VQTDVLIVGGGPAGIATAIAARMNGLSVTVLDARRPPIDKPCGEGLLPLGAAALRRLGIPLDSSLIFPFSGFRFCDENSSVTAPLPGTSAFGIRRTVLHCLLVGRALDLGVSFLWNTRALRFSSSGVDTSAGFIPYRWLVGADGYPSNVAAFAGLHGSARRFRFGFRRHYEIAPWSDRVEVHWGEKCQMIVTPTGAGEVCISFFTGDPRIRLNRALEKFPDVAQRISGAQSLSSHAGSVTLLSRARAAARGNVALVGDASCTVDGITGQGLSLAFQQALHLADAMACGGLARYRAAHRRIVRTPVRMTRLLLAMSASSSLRRKVLRLFAAKPALLSTLIAVHASESGTDALRAADFVNLGWRVIRA